MTLHLWPCPALPFPVGLSFWVPLQSLLLRLLQGCNSWAQQAGEPQIHHLLCPSPSPASSTGMCHNSPSGPLHLNCAFSYWWCLYCLPVDNRFPFSPSLSHSLHSPFLIQIHSKLTLLFPTTNAIVAAKDQRLLPFPRLLIFPASSFSAVKYNFHENQAISEYL